MENFPRELTETERMLLFALLPPEKSGYKMYRERINRLQITGTGRLAGGSRILGKPGTIPDRGYGPAPVFAIGSFYIRSDEYSIVIHEEEDDEIEFEISPDLPDISSKDLETILHSVWGYSAWNPGSAAPRDNTPVREVKISEKFILALAPQHKKIWLHNSKSGVNHLIPVTNFYNYLMIVKNIRDPKTVLAQNNLFAGLSSFTDSELRSALLLYNKYFKRFSLDTAAAPPPAPVKKRGLLSKLFHRG